MLLKEQQGFSYIAATIRSPPISQCCQPLFYLFQEKKKKREKGGLPILILSRPNVIFIEDIFLAILGYIIK